MENTAVIYSPEQGAQMQQYANYGGDADYGYEDDGLGYEGEDYTGFGDDFVDFGGDGVSFKNELATNRTFAVVIQNQTNSVKRLGLSPTMVALAGVTQLVEGDVLTEQNGTKVIANGSPNSLNILREYLKLNPTRLVGMQIESSAEAQTGRALVIEHVNPFEKSGSKTINFAQYKKETNLNAKFLTITGLDIPFDAQTSVAIDIVPESTTTITLYFGASLNAAKALNKKATRAKRSL